MSEQPVTLEMLLLALERAGGGEDADRFLCYALLREHPLLVLATTPVEAAAGATPVSLRALPARTGELLLCAFTHEAAARSLDDAYPLTLDAAAVFALALQDGLAGLVVNPTHTPLVIPPSDLRGLLQA